MVCDVFYACVVVVLPTVLNCSSTVTCLLVILILVLILFSLFFRIRLLFASP